MSSTALSRTITLAWGEVRDEPVVWLEPDLAGCPTPGATLARVRRGDDPVALALVREVQRGTDAAWLTLLVWLLGPLRGLVIRDRRLSLDDLVAAIYLRVMSHPCDRRRTGVRFGLLMDARRDVRSELPRALPAAFDPRPDPDDPAPSAGRIVTEAHRRGLVDDQSAAVLRSVYSDGLSSIEAGRRHALRPDAVRSRCSRAVTTLRAHRLELLDAA